MILPDRTTPPPIRDFVTLHIPNEHCQTLTDGVKLHVVKTGSAPASRVAIIWNYGSNRNPRSYAPSMVAPMLMQGCKTMSGTEIVDKIDFLGAFVNNKTTSSYTAFESLCLNTFSDRLLDILSEILTQPTFPVDRFEALKRKQLLQYDLLRSQTRYIAIEKLSNLLAGKNHPYFSKPSREEMEALTLEEVRKAWHQGLFTTQFDIFASGDITDVLFEKIANFARGLRPAPAQITYPEIIPLSPEEPGVRYVSMPDSKQSSIAIGIPAIPRSHPDYILLRIAVVALGGYFGSRLMTNIREEKGLTYGISAYLAATYEGAFINISADCDHRYVDKVLEEINSEMRKMAETPMDDEELTRLRSYYMTTVASTLESFKTIGEYYEQKLTVGLSDNYFENQQLAIENLTAEQIRAMAEKYFLTQKAITVVAGAKE